MKEVPQKLHLVLVIFLCIFQTSCSAPYRTKIDQGLLLGTDAKIEIGEITTDNPNENSSFAILMLRSALERQLNKQQILRSKDKNEKYYILSVIISHYQMGHAFYKWLLPIYGAPALKVECRLTDSNQRTVTKFEHKKIIIQQFLFDSDETIDIWGSIIADLIDSETGMGHFEIFDLLANDIAIDLKRRMTDKVEGFYIELDPWPENESYIPKAEIVKKIKLVPFEDQRLDQTKIGERYAAFNVPMGNVYLNTDVSIYLSDALQNDLLASGHRLTNSDYSIILQGEIKKFWISTETTPLYWDVIGEIEVKLSAIFTDSPKTTNKTIDKQYSAQSKSRTYIWPTKSVVSSVLSECIKKLMYEIRQDSIWTIKNKK